MNKTMYQVPLDFGNKFHYDDFISQNFVMNRLKNPELSIWERMIVFANSQEVDDMRQLERIPPNTDLYQFKLEQFKDRSSSRTEMEKVLHEQMLKEICFSVKQMQEVSERQKNDETWVKERQKKMVDGRIRKDFGPDPMLLVEKPEKLFPGQNQPSQQNQHNPMLNMKGYDPKQGFIVYWDFLINIQNENQQIDMINPKGINLVASIVCEGQTIMETFALDPKPIEEQNQKLLMGYFVDQSELKNVLVNPETLLIWEIQITNLENPDEEQPYILGWTQIDLFEICGDLKRGFWKCPFYKGPVDTNINKEKIQDLEVEYGPWIYLRIAFPWKDQYTLIESLDHKQTAGQYFIPEIHLRAAHYRPPVEIDYQQKVKYIEKPNEPQFSRKNLLQEQPRITDPTLNIQTNNIPSQKKKGIKITLHSIKKHIALSMNKVGIALLEGKNKIYDDNGRDCVSNSQVHNPINNNNSLSQSYENKAKGNDIIFNEEFIYLRNLPILYKKNELPINLVFQIMEKPEPREILKTDKISYKQVRTDNYGGMEYKLIGWCHFEVMNEQGFIKNGKFIVKVFKPPYKLPPINQNNVQISTMELEFSLLEYQYDQEDLKKQLEDRQKIIEKKQRQEQRKIQQPGDFDIKIDNRPFIPNIKAQYQDKTFVKGSGIDFYIDEIRFLPDNVTVTKILVQFINQNWEKQFDDLYILPKFNSQTYSPVFDFRHELRGDDMDSTMMAYMTLITRDKSCNENRLIGYSCINLFINRYSKTQPDNINDPDKILYDGYYEIPIIGDEHLRVNKFSVEKFLKHNKIPSASILIRIQQAQKSEDGKRVLNTKDFPKSEWKARNIWIPRPLYSSGKYNNQMKQLSQNEEELYSFRQGRNDITVKESALLLIHAENINKDLNDLEIFRWCDDNISKDHKSKLIDPMFFAKYQPQSGFKFILDGVNNVSKDQVFIGFYSINPPAKYYKEKSSSDLILNALINWDSPIGQTIFFDKWYYFRDIEFFSNLNIIIEIHSVKIKKEKIFIENYAWTMVQVFHPKGYTNSGNYQIPLFKYPVNLELVNEVINSDQEEVWNVVNHYLNENKISYMNNSSIFCRLLDCQREGQLENKMDLNTLDYKYLPSNKKQLKEFSYNGQIQQLNKKLSTIGQFIPDNHHKLDFNKLIIDKALSTFNITNFNFDFNQFFKKILFFGGRFFLY